MVAEDLVHAVSGALDGKVDMSTMQALLENKTNLLDFEALSLAVEGKAGTAAVESPEERSTAAAAQRMNNKLRFAQKLPNQHECFAPVQKHS